MFGIIIAITFGVVIVLLFSFYILKWRTIRRLPPPSDVQSPIDGSPANRDSREISFATISSNPRLQTFPAGPPPVAGQPPRPLAAYPVAAVDLAATPVGAPTYQPPPLETLPPTPTKSPSEHDFDL